MDATETAQEFRTRDQLRQYWRDTLNRPDRLLNFEVRQLEAQVDGKLGFVQGQWQTERENGQDGKKHLVGSLTLVMVQQNRQWRILHEHRSKLREVFVGMAVGGISTPGPALIGGKPEYAALQWKGDGKSGIEGEALASPIHGGPERIGEKNSGPLANALITIRPLNDDKPIASVRTDAQGRYRLPLKPGRYRLVPFGPQPGGRLPHAESREVVITNGRFIRVQIDYDTGLR